MDIPAGFVYHFTRIIAMRAALVCVSAILLLCLVGVNAQLRVGLGIYDVTGWWILNPLTLMRLTQDG